MFQNDRWSPWDHRQNITEENFSLINNPENRIYQEQQVHKCVIQHLLKFLVDKTKQIEI
jgi:hypothetical protein